MENNVVSLFKRRPAQENELNAQRPARPSTPSSAAVSDAPTSASPVSEAPGVPRGDFAAIAERNRQIQEKLRKEREQANKAVLKSYRIK